MRMPPPISRNAAWARGGASGKTFDAGIRLHLTNRSAPKLQGVITAIPAGRHWRIKAQSDNGDVAVLGLFSGRLEALGAAVLLARNTGAEVVP
jgi:hypothetical protein